MGFLAGLFAGLVIGHIWFWMIVVSIALVLMIEMDASAGWLTLVTILILATIWFGFRPAVTYAVTHPLNVLKVVGIYFLGGVIWGPIKWAAFLHRISGKYNHHKALFLETKGVTELTPALANEFRGQLHVYYADIPTTVPTAAAYKSDIVRWMTYWPFSIVGTMLHDVVAEIWNHLYLFMNKRYNAIANRLYGHIAVDMAMAADGETPKSKR